MVDPPLARRAKQLVTTRIRYLTKRGFDVTPVSTRNKTRFLG